MQAQPGVFITIEGIDDAGKAAQCALLRDRLEAAGYDVLLVSFPRNDEPSSYFIREYLRGAYGSSETVGPYTAALFYALDRFQTAPRIRKALSRGAIVIADRFMSSSLAHQGMKIQHPEERRGFFIWLDNLEFYMLGIPRPALNLILRVPADIAADHSVQPVDANDNHRPKDTFESDPNHLQQVARIYDELCALFPKDFTQIDCVRNEMLLDPQAVQRLIWGTVEPMLPVATQATSVAENMHPTSVSPTESGGFFVPPSLSGTIRQRYLDTMTELTVNREQLANRLRMYAAAQVDALIEVEQAITQLMPVALYPDIVPADADAALSQLITAQLPAAHTGSGEETRLIQALPRNELDIVADAAYSLSDRSFDEVQRDVASWSYEQKASVLRTLIGNVPQQSVLEHLRYTWDCTTSIADYLQLERRLNRTIGDHQVLSPRLGYQTPNVVEQAGASDAFDCCFDLSLQLYSQLQAAHLNHEAQYAMLLGHRLRWRVTLNAQELVALTRPTPQSADMQLLGTFRQSLSEVHPIIGTALTARDQAPTAPVTVSPEMPAPAAMTLD